LEVAATVKGFETRILNLSAALGLYDRWADRHLREIHVTLLDMAHLSGKETILDLGCGTGRLAALVKQHHPDVQAKGIDPSPQMIKAARKRNQRNIPAGNFVIAHATDLPFEDDSFDTVFTCLVLHLLDRNETERALQEIHRVLKPQGRYISIEFQSYPAHWLSSKQAAYPEDLLPKANLSVATETPGPAITRRHHATYRIITAADTRQT
jgi:ubiquinone/menaquinone biosynthesis C-methylase UbiE